MAWAITIALLSSACSQSLFVARSNAEHRPREDCAVYSKFLMSMTWTVLFTITPLQSACLQSRFVARRNPELPTRDLRLDARLRCGGGDLRRQRVGHVECDCEMDSIFHQARVLESNMEGVFRACAAYNQDIGGWDTSKVTSMEGMFNACATFNQDAGGWDVSRVTSVEYMFMGPLPSTKTLAAGIRSTWRAWRGYSPRPLTSTRTSAAEIRPDWRAWWRCSSMPMYLTQALAAGTRPE